jgi:hypothetical protein
MSTPESRGNRPEQGKKAQSQLKDGAEEPELKAGYPPEQY